MTPKAVVFDIGNVILNWDPDILYRKLVPDDAERLAFFQATDMHRINLEIDRGAPFKETLYSHAEALPEYADLIRAWHDRWREMLTPEIAGTSAILRELKNLGTPVFALSNFGVDTYELAKKIYPILCEFDREYISGRMKLTKPDPRIYAAVEKDSGLNGPELCFFDDRQDNIDAAKTRGWQAYLFENPMKLREDLISVGKLNHR